MASRRVLIVSPHFPPINAPDHQRVRMSLPFFGDFGWKPTVLAVRPEEVAGTDDPLLVRTLPADTEIIRTGAVPARWTRRVGLGSLAWRALPSFGRVGGRLLARGGFDAVYFSTTMFAVMALGPAWRRRFGVPYAVDFQDPWVEDYYWSPGAPPPPGGRFKYGLDQWLARRLEPRVVCGASQVISVSPGYVEALCRRYPDVDPARFTVIPFGAPDRDFDQIDALGVRQMVFDPTDGRRHWVYVGRGGADMATALRLLFGAVAAARAANPQAWATLRMHFVGTSYAPADRAEKTVEPVARACGVADLVEERTGRVPYFESLQLLRQSEAILVIGSDSSGYSASKLYPCMLARRPLLAVMREDGPATAILRRCRVGEVVTFRPGQEGNGATAQAAVEALFAQASRRIADFDLEWFVAEHGARVVTSRQCAVLDRVAGDRRPSGQ